MGNIFGSDYLKEPITEKNSTDEENDKLNCGTSTMQGWRLSQEDAHNCILDYDKDKSTSYFAVYDGHGGRAVAIYCSEQLPNFLKELEDFKNGKMEKALEEAFLKFDSSLTTDEIMQKIKELSGEDLDVESEDEENINNLYEEASMPLEKVIEKYTSNPDEDNSSNENSKLSKEANDIKSETPKDDAPDSQQNCTSTRKNSTETEVFSNPIKHCGCTAVVAVLKGNDLYVANAGDSRCIVSRNGDAIEMSIDHKPLNEIEEARIIKAGGWVCVRGNRVNGGLNLSRAIGDHRYKQNDKLSDREQMITALPDVKTLKINPDEDEFMVLACDGIWNSMTSQEVVDFVRPKIQNKMKLSKICEEMFEHCLAPSPLSDWYGRGTGCDNMTAIIVQFKSANEKKSTSAEPEETNPHKKMKTDEAKTEAVA